MSRLPGVGESFGRYQLLEQLGRGGMGVVYAAHDGVLNRKVALKLVAPHLSDDPEFRTRFAREAETQARLDSPHVVRIYDYGELDGVLFLSTQLIEGANLASLVATQGALAPAAAVRVVAQVLDGLQAAHDAGVVHRDVKPANVLVRQRGGTSAAYLCDFGIATTAGNDVTRTGQVIGSLPWMAPERHYGQNPGAVGDVYSAGCLLYFALTGTAPYVGSDGEVMRGHLEGSVPQLVGRTPFLKKVNAVLAKALAKDPDRRYASAGAMAADVLGLAPLAQAEPVLADTTIRRPAVVPAGTTTYRAVTRPVDRRIPWLTPLVIAVLSLLAAVAGGLGMRAINDDAELAAGAVETTVAGRTVTMAPQPTLSPLASPSVATSAAAPVGEVATGGQAAVPPPAPAKRPRRSSTAAAPVQNAPAPVATVAARPHYTYRCWDSASHLVNDLATCGLPKGTVGAEWMQSAWRSSCWKASPGGPIVESWGCGVSGASYYISRASAANEGASWLRARMPDDQISNDWFTGTVRAGSAYQGTAMINGAKRYRWGAVYAIGGGTWLVYVDGTTADGRLAGRKALEGHYRHIHNVRGLECAKTTCVGNG